MCPHTHTHSLAGRHVAAVIAEPSFGDVARFRGARLATGAAAAVFALLLGRHRRARMTRVAVGDALILAPLLLVLLQLKIPLSTLVHFVLHDSRTHCTLLAHHKTCGIAPSEVTHHAELAHPAGPLARHPAQRWLHTIHMHGARTVVAHYQLVRLFAAAHAHSLSRGLGDALKTVPVTVGHSGYLWLQNENCVN